MAASVSVFDPRICTLGEGAFWHPERNQPFWFDILGRRLHSLEGDQPRTWQFNEFVSAAGWIDRDRLLIASQSALFAFDLVTDTRQDLVPLEADLPANRSNDGRADPQGGFWIGTMALDAATGAGAIYRYFDGELRKLVADVSIPNAIAFSPDGGLAYYADTARHLIWRQGLDAQGWPQGEPVVFADLSAQGLFPDGAVTDAQGNLWCALWGTAQLVCFDPSGRQSQSVTLPAKQPTCPAFIGEALDRLMVTSAAVGLRGPDDSPENGKTWAVDQAGLRGLPAPRVRMTP